MTFYHVKDFGDYFNENVKITPDGVVKNENDCGPETVKENPENLKSGDKLTPEVMFKIYEYMKSMDENCHDKYSMQWKIVSRILDKFMFLLNMIAMALAMVMDTSLCSHTSDV